MRLVDRGALAYTEHYTRSHQGRKTNTNTNENTNTKTNVQPRRPVDRGALHIQSIILGHTKNKYKYK